MYASNLLVALLSAVAVNGAFQFPDTSPQLQKILNKAHTGKYFYPTSITQGIVPKGIHSHNDYWRDVPFYTALSAGCISIEADVWNYNGTLYIGHEESALTTARTFDSLYIEPILSVLKAQNPTNSSFLTGPTSNGVFDTNGDQTLYLFVDVKTDGETTWPHVVNALQPLRSAGFLTTVNTSGVTQGPVTVVGTGYTPLDQIQGVLPRDYFYDAPIPMLNTTFSNITSDVSPIASTDFDAVFGFINGTTFNETQLELLRSQIAIAHGKGIMVRYWDQPGWPISTRDGIWRTLVSEGADLINADDVIAAAGFSDRSGYW